MKDGYSLLRDLGLTDKQIETIELLAKRDTVRNQLSIGMIARKREEQIYNHIMSAPVATRYTWCGADDSGCACNGCINQFLPGIEKETWDKWVDNNPPPETKLDRFWTEVSRNKTNGMINIETLKPIVEKLYEVLIREY